MIRTTDGSGQYKRIPSVGDLHPTATGFQREVASYTATGGETSINLALLSPALSYMPGRHQLSIKRSSGGALMVGLDFTETSSTTVGFSDPLVAGEIVEITKEFTVTGVMAVEPRPDCYTATATTGQTLVTCDFSWPYNLNAGKAIGGVKVFVQGFLWKRGVEYTEVNLGTTNTNQILVADGFVGGEDIVILPAYQAIDQTAGASTLANQSLASLQSMMAAGSQGFVDQSTDMIAVPNTAIVGRAKIPNLANDLRASLGIERIAVQSIMQLQNEFGPNGEPVYAVLNDDRGLIRFVGGWGQYNDAYGARVYAGTAGYIEVVFYGTGLNILSAANTGVDAVLVSYDGGSETSVNLNLANQSSILAARGYAQNCVVPVITALPLGVHTVKLRWAAVAGTSYQGFEILNANASGLININPGVGYINGQKYVNSAADSIDYRTGVTGARGGRVVRYLNSDGSVGQAFTAVNAAQANLTSADHTNEEVARAYHWREFGAGRADDFSLLPITGVSNAAFTLDDGTTTLVGSQVASDQMSGKPEGLRVNALGSFITFTFVGTGLDLLMFDNGTGGNDTYTYSIDGATPSAWPYTSGSTTLRTQKIVSGLPYGTHTFKLTRGAAATWVPEVCKFIVYGPKKPTIPATALELCDYNVMAALVGNSTAGIETISQGVLRKEISQREAVYVGGGWALPIIYPATAVGGWQAYTGTVGQYVEYTFFGTGFEKRCYSTPGATFTVQVDGAFPAAVTYYGGYNSYTPATGALTANVGTVASGFRVVGLSLGVHKVKVTLASGTYLYTEAMDIITPIHSTKSNLYADLQNTLPVGSCSLMDSRKTSMVKEIVPASKSWAQAVGVTASPSTTSTTAVPMADMSVTIRTTGGALKIDYKACVYNTAVGNYMATQVYVDGVAVGSISSMNSTTISYAVELTDGFIVPCAPGVHKVDLYWFCQGGTTTVDSGKRTLTVQEL